MEIVFNRDEALPALSAVVGAAVKKSTIPILSNVRIRANSQGAIRFDTTDLEIAWFAFALGSIPQDCDIAVDARKILDIVKAAPVGKEIKAKVADGKMAVRFGGSRFSLSVLDGMDFPDWDSADPICSMETDSSEFLSMMDATSFAVAKDDVRYYLQGMLFSIESGTLKVAATDGHRLAVSTLGEKATECMDMQAIIPGKAIDQLRKTAQGESFAIRFFPDQVHFCMGEKTLRTKVIEGKYPDYQKVIPDGHPYALTADASSLSDSLKRVSIVGKDAKGVTLKVGADSCEIVARNYQNEEATEVADVEYSGEPMDIAFSAQYLVDVLNAIQTSHVRITLKDSNAAIRVEPSPANGDVYVVMPMRL